MKAAIKTKYKIRIKMRTNSDLDHNSDKQLKNIENIQNEVHKLEVCHNVCNSLANSLQELILKLETLKKEKDELVHAITKSEPEDMETLKNHILDENADYDSQNILDEKDVANDLQNLYCLLGYSITDAEFVDGKINVLTFNYNARCYVKLANEEDCWHLIEIYPSHPNFDSIKEFLYKTQDTSGLLRNLRKYFADSSSD
ncbi:uncharacterized protein LOC119669883 [Teleopsis dalmanni]|uniref:uncharacterized protein LOC119669822 n=1 Tax=Teleopsis dalmanni TaxID=139649 RepID=UPI0018CEE0A5|nr:uncharacterized protein LOC119669822 [Teleopsis dalmanni]XP_037935850.1 uncharacterized protein LOC119669883 [Teleopsis dalmanni]